MAAVTAVPLNGIAKLGFDAFDVTVTVPVNVPADVGANFTVNVVLCPAVSVTGGVIPEMLYPVPVAATAEIVALVAPVFLIVSVWLELCPTVMFVYVKLVGDAVRTAGAPSAVPLSGIDKLGFEASDVTVTVPLNVVALVGENFTVNVVLCPGVNVTGGVIPETLNPAPASATAEIVAFVPPVFLIVSVWLELCPTVTFVYVKLVGDAVRTAGGATAVPVNGIDKLGFDAFDVTVTVPGKLPTAVGANVTLNDMVAPGTNVPAVNPETLYPVPAAVAAEIVVLTPPVFVRVTVWLEVWPVVMFVKLRLAGVGVTTAGTAVEPPDPEYPRYTALLTPFTVSATAPSVPGNATGENVTPNVVVWPGARVSGRFKFTTPKPAPITVT